jgi:hypothetical protein
MNAAAERLLDTDTQSLILLAARAAVDTCEVPLTGSEREAMTLCAAELLVKAGAFASGGELRLPK